MVRRTPHSQRTDTHVPDTTLSRSDAGLDVAAGHRHLAEHLEELRRLRPHLLGQREAVDQDGLAAAPVELLAEEALQARRVVAVGGVCVRLQRSEEHTSELQSLMRISYAVFCLNTKKPQHIRP